MAINYQKPLPPTAAQSVAARTLQAEGVEPLLAAILSKRGIKRRNEIDYELKHLLPPSALKGIDSAVQQLSQAIDNGQKLLVVADYDCDGATGCAVLIRGLRMMTATVDFLVPNRFVHGYGLSPELVDLAANHSRMGKPDWIITVDNGIASIDGVDRANELGIKVIVTDHHLPAHTLPKAHAIVNPNQPGCSFPSKSLAGVGVALYLLLALRAYRRTIHQSLANVPLQELLDLVALGTVADVVALDKNNRILVNAGLERIRQGKSTPGIRALFNNAKRNWRDASSSDLAFSIGPRVNAAGRLQDISLGIACLLSDTDEEAEKIAQTLENVNRERRALQTVMQQQARIDLSDAQAEQSRVLVVFNPDWHEGLIGLVAGQLKEQYQKPCFAFAPSASDPQWLKGSGRSIAGLHLRDFLDLITKASPGIPTSHLPRFGGHAMAAGLSLHRDSYELFIQLVHDTADTKVSDDILNVSRQIDLSLEPGEFTFENAVAIKDQPWGSAFEEPLFHGIFKVKVQKLLQNKHSKLSLSPIGDDETSLNAIFFNHQQPLSSPSQLAYRLARDEFRGERKIQLIIEAVVPPISTIQP